MYDIIFSPLAQKKFGKLTKKMQGRIISSLKRIRIRPESFVKKLVGYDSLYRLRVGEYRVILEIDGNKLIILVVTLGPRKSIYKNF